jgi:WD40 repeat protein
MRAKTLQIIWHEKEPVFSADFHPGGYLATGGADREIKVQIWAARGRLGAGPRRGGGDLAGANLF